MDAKLTIHSKIGNCTCCNSIYGFILGASEQCQQGLKTSSFYNLLLICFCILDGNCNHFGQIQKEAGPFCPRSAHGVCRNIILLWCRLSKANLSKKRWSKNRNKLCEATLNTTKHSSDIAQ